MSNHPRRNSKRSLRPNDATETTQPDTESVRQRTVSEVENLKNSKAENLIAVGHEIETRKHRLVFIGASEEGVSESPFLQLCNHS